MRFEGANRVVPATDGHPTVLQKTNRFAAIIRIACDILMFVLEIVYEGFC